MTEMFVLLAALLLVLLLVWMLRRNAQDRKRLERELAAEREQERRLDGDQSR